MPGMHTLDLTNYFAIVLSFASVVFFVELCFFLDRTLHDDMSNDEFSECSAIIFLGKEDPLC
jgi:hypothetical protein